MKDYLKKKVYFTDGTDMPRWLYDLWGYTMYFAVFGVALSGIRVIWEALINN